MTVLEFLQSHTDEEIVENVVTAWYGWRDDPTNPKSREGYLLADGLDFRYFTMSDDQYDYREAVSEMLMDWLHSSINGPLLPYKKEESHEEQIH